MSVIQIKQTLLSTNLTNSMINAEKMIVEEVAYMARHLLWKIREANIDPKECDISIELRTVPHIDETDPTIDGSYAHAKKLYMERKRLEESS